MSMIKKPFHMSLPCSDIGKTKNFYVNVIGAGLGRNSSKWMDIDLFGNQITFAGSGDFEFSFKSYKFEETVVPSFHFGAIVDRTIWDQLYNRLKGSHYELTAEATFLRSQTGKHTSFFVKDPNGHRVELKCFKGQKEIFA